MSFPPVPPEVKGIAHFLKVADEHDARNIVISYWCRMHACQSIMKIVPGKKPPAVSSLLIALLDWLEATKKSNHNTEGISDETTAQAIIEQYALQLFSFADSQDRAGNFNKNTVKAFYTAGVLMDILEQFGEPSEDIASRRKYAKWKAAYIHNCLKAGEIPQPGGYNEDADANEDNSSLNEDAGPSNSGNESPNAADNTTPPNYMDETTNPIAPAPAPSPITPPVAPTVVPFTPSVPSTPSDNGGGPNISPDVIQKAQKYCKYATSALNYDDVNTAIGNLVKALSLLQTGKEE